VVSPEASDALCQYHWSGNIRELENFLERTVILHRDPLDFVLQDAPARNRIAGAWPPRRFPRNLTTAA
jgi:transcriptional regulator with PAS, ATPase and Fis domain